MSGSLKGRVQSAATLAAALEAAKRPRSEAWKKKMSAFWRRRGHPPGHPEYRFWTKREDALLGTATDAKVRPAHRAVVGCGVLPTGEAGYPCVPPPAETTTSRG